MKAMNFSSTGGASVAPAATSGARVRVELPAAMLAPLLADGRLSASDLRSLDTASAECLRELCLNNIRAAGGVLAQLRGHATDMCLRCRACVSADR